MDPTKRLLGTELTEFLATLGISKEEPVGRSSASGESVEETRLDDLLQKGDPLLPCPPRVTEDAETLQRLFATAGTLACFGLTPDGHLSSHQPINFDPDKAVQQVIALVEANLGDDDRQEGLAASWLGLAFHDHDHPADFAGLLLDARDGLPKCCYLDVKGTKAITPGAQRTKLEQRAQERKFGCLALTVSTTANNGFAGYPGRGKPGLVVTLLHNPVTAGKKHSGYAVGWFFGISSNYQATAAVWGWGGAQGVKLPEELQRDLKAREIPLQEGVTNLLELLGRYRDYSQFRDDQGEWDRERLRFTLVAKFFAARYLLMHEDATAHAEQTVENLQPSGVEVRLDPRDFHPGESWATYFGRKADEANRRADEVSRQRDEEKRQREEAERKAEEAERKAEEAGRQRDEAKRKADEAERRANEASRQRDEDKRKADAATQRFTQMILRLRQKGHSDEEIAEDLGCTVQELQQSHPRTS